MCRLIAARPVASTGIEISAANWSRWWSLHAVSWPLTRSGAVVGKEKLIQPFHFKALSAALGIVAAVAVIAQGRAQQGPPAAGQEPAPDAKPQDGGAAQTPTSQAPVRAARARSAAVTATVNLRSGPGTDQEIITTIPAGSTVRVTSCSGEWCELTWN